MRHERAFAFLAFAASVAAGSVAARAGETTRVSVDSAGVQGNDSSCCPSISADGRFVAFQSRAWNLVPGDGNAALDVFVHDRLTGVTSCASVNSAGVPGNLASRYPSISADGRFVAFDSEASNLVPQDSNRQRDIFVRDRAIGVTALVSVGSGGVQANGFSERPSISADGRFVAFRSFARNLVPGYGNGGNQIYVHDRATGVSTIVSVDSTGAAGNLDSRIASISSNGRFVSFSSWALNLVPGDTNGREDVFVHDRATGETTRVSVTSAGVQGNYDSSTPSISADGRFVAFQSLASIFDPGDRNLVEDVFVHDRATGIMARASVSSAGVRGNWISEVASISADGRFVAFHSDATNLVPADANRVRDVFVHDRATGMTSRVSVSSAGAEGGGSSMNASISADGGFVAFESLAWNLVPRDTNFASDVFVHDVPTTRVRRVTPAAGSEAGSDYVTVEGENLTGVGPTRVLFGAGLAFNLEVTSSRILVRTPPGAGTVGVTVQWAFGSATLDGAYTYVAPHVAARYGNVNAPAGYREDVLFVNASAGDPLARELLAGVGQPIVTAMTAPSSLAQARFALYAWLREPNASTLTPLPRDLGAMVIAPPFLGRTPPVIWNNLGYRQVLGTSTLSSRPAPSVVFRSEGSSSPITFTLQGFIEDAGSPIPEGVSVTNALVVRVQ